MGERLDDFHEFEEGSRPAMGHEDGFGIFAGSFDVQEMNVETVDGGDELAETG